MTIQSMKFSLLLFALAQLIRHCARKYPAFKARLAEKNFTAQIMTRDGLQRGTDPLAELETDSFGDFKFDGLDPESGAYRLQVIGADGSEAALEVSLGESVSCGTIML